MIAGYPIVQWKWCVPKVFMYKTSSYNLAGYKNRMSAYTSHLTRLGTLPEYLRAYLTANEMYLPGIYWLHNSRVQIAPIRTS